MKLDLTDMLYAMSYALDAIEEEMLGIATKHGKHVAYLSFFMGEEAGFEEEELRDFVGCCILHDNALTEFFQEELLKNPIGKGSEVKIPEKIDPDLVFNHSGHSVIGEQNIRLMPFRTNVENIILYHHENADGTGPLGKPASETGLKSQILHLTDMVDVACKLEKITEKEFDEISKWVRSQSGKMFSEESVTLFEKTINFEKICVLKDKGIIDVLKELMKTKVCDYSDEEIHNIAGLFARIVDYKSEYTEKHSIGVSVKAEQMADYYGFDAEKRIRFYFAAAMHDIGKLVVKNDILEKAGRLTDEEFITIENHASATYYILSQMRGIPDIIEWASNHHEKLNGTGYPRGLTAESLSFEDRLMACIDIYQALTGKRSYKDEWSHEKAISIMMDMVGRGELDEKIVRDMDFVMARA